MISATCSGGRGVVGLTRLNVDGGIFRIGDGEGKLSADVPPLGRGLLFSIIEVDRDHIVRLSVGVAHRKE